jgi:CDP-diacylglycerol--glycerol-3-phosphate 3-phosphatidyltransferase
MSVKLIAIVATYWMTILSIISAIDYFVGFWKKIDHVSTGTRRSSSVLSRNKKTDAVVEAGIRD